MPPEATFMRPISPGIVLDLHHRTDGQAMSLYGDFRIYNDVIAVGDMLHGYSNWSAQAGIQYALDTAPDWSPFISGTVHRTQTSIFRFVDTSEESNSTEEEDEESDDSDAEGTGNLNQFAPAVEALYGVLIGGGIQRYISNDLLLVAAISELFAPYPIATEIRGSVSRELNSDWSVRGGIDLNIKHVGMSINGVPLKVRDTEASFSAGVVYRGL